MYFLPFYTSAFCRKIFIKKGLMDAFCFVKNKEPQKNIATLFVIFIGFL